VVRCRHPARVDRLIGLQELHPGAPLPKTAVGPFRRGMRHLGRRWRRSRGPGQPPVLSVPKRHAGPRSRRRPATSARFPTRRARPWKTGNPALDGVLAGIDYNDEQKLGDSKNRDNVLSRLVQHFPAATCATPTCPSRTCSAALRVPDREVRRRRGQEGRRILHAQRRWSS